MKYILIAWMLSSLHVSTCNKPKDQVPACIQQKIDQIKGQPKWNPPAEVNEYNYKGQRTFLFTSDCCDRYIELVDANCNYICAPSGGYTGKGDGKCSDFNDAATHVRLIWKDPR